MRTDSARRRGARRLALLAVVLASLLGVSTLSSASPAEAAAGDEIVFARYFPLGLVIEDIYTTELSGAGDTQLTNSPTITDNSPSWSPTGSHIVFARGKDVAGAPVHLWVIELRSGSERQVTFGDVVDYFPDWR